MKNLLLVMALASLFAACSDDPPAPVDASSDIQGDTQDGVGSDVEADGDGSSDASGQEPALVYHFEGAQGAVGVGESTLTLTSGDDLDSTAPGVQVNVAAQTTYVETGRIISVFVNGAAAAAGPVNASGDEGEGNILLTLNASEATQVRVTVTNQAGVEAADEKTVVVATDACSVALDPVAADGCFGVDAEPETPGVQAVVKVGTVDAVACPSATLTVTSGGEVITLGPSDMDAEGQASFVLTLADDGEAVEKEIGLTATVHHGSDPGKDAVLASSYSFDNVPPEIVVTSPNPEIVSVISAADDEDDVAAGIQLTVQGQVTGAPEAPAEAVTLSVNGEVAGTTVVDGGAFTYQVTILDVGTTTLTVEALDACGIAGSASLTFDAFPVAPSLVVLSPADNAVLLAKDDGEPATPGYELDFSVQIDAPNAGDTLWIQCRSKAGNEQIFFDLSEAVVAEPFPGDNLWTLPTTLDPGALSNEVVCRAYLDGPNPSASPNIHLQVALPGPSIVLEGPADSSLLNVKSFVVSGSASGLDGIGLTARLIGSAGVVVTELAMDPVSGGLFSQVVDFEASQPFADGQYTVEVDATDVFGNVASELGTSGKSVVTFDTLAPLLVAVQPAGVFISGAADEDPGTPGFQTIVIMALNNEVFAEGAEICLSVAGEDLGCQGVAPATFEASWSGVTLQPGANNPLVATGVDAAGNAANPYSVTLNLDVDAPVVTIIDPAANFTTIAPSLDLVAHLEDSQSGSPITGAAPTLQLNGAASGLVAENSGDGTYTFLGISLIDGENQLQVLVDIGAQGASPLRTVTLKADEPSIALTSPGSDQTFNLASPECGGISPDCPTVVTASVASAGDGSITMLSVDCGGTVVEVASTVSAGNTVFSGVVLTHGVVCTLTPQVTDLAQQTVNGAPVSITVDRVAPVISRFDEPFEAFLQPNVDQDPATPGIQYKLQVVVQGVEAGQTLSVDVHLQGQGGGSVYDSVLPADAPAGVDTEVNFPVISYPDGSVECSASVSDQAGNSATLDKLVFVQSEKPAVQFKAPTNPSSDCADCGSTGVCQAGTCWFKWNSAFDGKVYVTLGGFLAGDDNFRICSDASSLAGGTPCESAGFVQVFVGAGQEGLQTVDLSAILPAGFQTLVAELQLAAGGAWETSLDELTEADRSRRVNVDVTAPQVSSVASSSDTEAPVDVLNINEQVGGQPVGTYQFEFVSDEAGAADVFVNGQLQETVAAASGENSTTVELLPGGAEIYVRVTDLNGNVSAGLPAALSYTPVVDLTAPALSFNTPKDASWVGGAGAQDVVLSVGLEQNEDEGAVTVTLLDQGAIVDSVAVSGGVATFVGALTEGAHSLTATVADPAGNTSTAATSPATVTADFTAPVALITSPTAGATISDDADPTGGFQIAVAFDAGDALADGNWTLTRADCPDNTFTGCSAPVIVSTGTEASVQSLSELVTVTISGAESYVSVALDVTDEAGNTASDVIDVTVMVTDCVVSFVGLPSNWLNQSHCAPGTDCDVTVSVLPSASCGNHTLTLSDGASPLGQVAATGGVQTDFAVTFSDGQSVNLQALATIGGSEVGASEVAALTVDTVLPVVTFVATLVDGFLTPSDGSSEIYNAAHDQSPATGLTLEMHGSVRVTDTHALAGSVVSVVRTEVSDPANTAALAPNVTTGANGVDLEITLRNISLPEQDVTRIDVTVQDAAGNLGVATFTGEADMAKPSSPFLSSGAVNPRLPSVALSWNATADNGGSGSPASSYDVRYSRTPITSVNFDAACSVSGLEHGAVVPSPGAPGATENYLVTGPDPRPESDPCKFRTDEADGNWSFAVRITDDAGNHSLMVGIAIANTADVKVGSTTITFSDTFRDDVLGGVAAKRDSLTRVGAVLGDVDGDGFADMAVGHWSADTMCVIYGSDAMPAAWTIDAKVSTTGLRHACLQPADLSAPELAGATGLGGATINLGDVNGDGNPDFATSAKVSGKGVLLVYLGRVGGTPVDLPNPDVIIQTDMSSGPPAYGFFCGAGSFMGSAAGAIGIGTVGFGNAFKVLSGDVSWTVGGGAVVDLASPAGLDLLTINADSPVFGWGAFCNTVGDVMATPGGGGAADDLLIQRIAGDTDDPLYLVPGRSVNGNQSVTLSLADPPVPSGEDANILRLRQEAGNLKAGFGSGGFFGSDVTGDGVPDVVIAHYSRQVAQGGDGKSVMIFDGQVLAQTSPGTYLRVGATTQVDRAWTGVNGTILDMGLTATSPSVSAAGNWDGWLFGGVVTIDLFNVDEDGVGALRANQANAAGDYELGLFHGEDFTVTSDGIGPTGEWVVGGHDVDGQAGNDIVTGTAQGTVVVIR